MKENRTVNELLKECRERANMKQEELAKILNVDRSTISKVETGIIKDPTYTLVRQWCAATQGLDLMSLDMEGGIEVWKKVRKMEETLRNLKLTMDAVSLRRNSEEGQEKKRAGWANFGSLRGRIRSR